MGFMRGKFYNRCVRVHEILALALESLLFEEFLGTLSDDDMTRCDILRASLPENVDEDVAMLGDSLEFKSIAKQYQAYFKYVCNGGRGPTAQYWGQYVFIVNRLHRNLMRCVRTNDINSYIDLLPSITNVFFGLNRPNYARWSVLFHHKLRNATPDMMEVLRGGAFSIRRTSKNYCRSAIDLTLEQTVNKTSASAAKGLVHFQNSEGSIDRWAITSHQRNMILVELFSKLNMEPTERPCALNYE